MKVIKNGYAILTKRGKLAVHNAQFSTYTYRIVAKHDLAEIYGGEGRIVRVALVETK